MYKKISIIVLSIIMVLSAMPFVAYAGTPKVPSSIEVVVGGQKTIPCNLDDCEGQRKNWRTNSGCFKISRGGTVTGLSQGEGVATVTTGVNGEQATCKVIVKPAAVLSLSAGSLSLVKGQTKKIKCTVSPSGASKSIMWSSTNTEVATVDDNGNVVARGTGRCSIICNALDGAGGKATCSVKVTSKSETTTRKKRKKSSSGGKKGNTTKQTATAKNKENSAKKEKTTAPHTTQRETTTRGSVNVAADQTTRQVTTEHTTTQIYIIDDDTGETTSVFIEEPEEMEDLIVGNEYSYIIQEYKLKGSSKRKQPIVLSWTNLSDVDGYEVYRSEDCVNFALVYDGALNEYKQHKFQYGKTYYYILRSYHVINGRKVFDVASDVLVQKAVNKGWF